MSLTLREINLLKQRRKKSGPPYGVDFKRELTSSVLTSRGFHCILFVLMVCMFFHLQSRLSVSWA